MKALITGASGFIGLHLMEELQNKGIEAIGFDLKNGQDIRRLNKDFDLNYDIVFHLAALRGVPESFRHAEEYFSTNIWGTYNILRLFSGPIFKKARIINISSSSAIGMLSPYGASKACGELLASKFPNAVTLRPFNVFGERQFTEAVIPSFIRDSIAQRSSIIYGDGTQTRDFTYVKDVVKEMIWYAENDLTGIHDMGYAQERSVNQILKKIQKAFDCNARPNYVPARPGEQFRSKAREKFHVKTAGFDKGLDNTIKYFRKQSADGNLTASLS